jgi:uncharacterized protein
MKIQPDRYDVQNVTAYGPGWLALNGEQIAHSVVFGSRGERFAWHCPTLTALSLAHFEQLAALDPEVVLFGSGALLRFPPTALLQPLIRAGIGLETMDSAAACRTYNILAGEGRHVVCAILLEQPDNRPPQPASPMQSPDAGTHFR